MGLQVPCGLDSQMQAEGIYTQSSGSIWGKLFKTLAQQKESKILEGHLMVDHVHMLISIPPKYGVSQVVGFIKGKSAIHIARVFQRRKRDFTGHNFWAKGYFVSTVGRDEKIIREHIKKQEAEGKRLDQLQMF